MKFNPGMYILDGRIPVLCEDRLKWAEFIEDPYKRRVELTEFADVTVSTVFLGLDHNYDGTGPPLLFETMTFYKETGAAGEFQQRYSTWEDAEAGHVLEVERQLELLPTRKGIVHDQPE